MSYAFLSFMKGAIVTFIFIFVIDNIVSYFRNIKLKKKIKRDLEEFEKKYGDVKFDCPPRTSGYFTPKIDN